MQQQKDIIISSDYFGKNVRLEGILERDLNLVYGMNGSGKSTLARALRDFAASCGDSLPFDEASDAASDGDSGYSRTSAEAHSAGSGVAAGGSGLDGRGGTAVSFDVPLEEWERRNIFVFNEDYLRRNIEISSEGLEAILSVGRDIDNKEARKAIEAKVTGLKGDIASAEAVLKRCGDTLPLLEKKILAQVNGDGGYAGRVRDASGLRNKKKIDVAEITGRIEALRPSMESAGSVAVLSQKVKNLADDLVKAKGGSKISGWTAPVFPQETLCREVLPLLLQVVERPELTDREEYIVGLVQQSVPVLDLSEKVLLQDGASFCPFCHQDIPQGHQQRLKENLRHIRQVLEDKSRAFVQELQDKSSWMQAHRPRYDASVLSAVDASEMEAAVQKVDNEWDAIVALLEKRLANPYLPIEVAVQEDVESVGRQLDDAVKVIQQRIAAYNKSIESRDERWKAFDELNHWLAYLENQKDIDDYIYCLKEEEDAGKLKVKSLIRLDECSHEIEKLLAAATNTSDAMDDIIRGLNHIYASPDRLSLEAVTDTETHQTRYRLISHGRAVRPDRISEGERNAIGLVYFFASSFAELGKRANKASLFVVDDPISSFDRGTRIGITSFMKDMFYHILSDEESKVLVLSHDLHTINDLVASRRELWRSLNRGHKPSSPETREPVADALLLRNRCLTPFSKNHNNYLGLLDEVFDFAFETGMGGSDDSIGNTIRRWMEAYSTFNYQMGISDMLTSRRLLSAFDDRLKDYYRTLSVMPFLNTESHTAVSFDAVDPDSVLYDEGEKRRIAKSLLAFIYITHPFHLENSLYRDNREDRKNGLHELKTWLKAQPWAESIFERKTSEPSRPPVGAEEYEGKVFRVEQDANGDIHCGKCLLPKSAEHFLGYEVQLSDVRENTNFRNSREYPLFGRYSV